MVDAPVSGGIAAASAGTLTFMVGGTGAAFARAEPILQAMGKAVIHAGDAGAGQAAKICNNMILGATMIATCEALALAVRAGPRSAALLRHRLRGIRPELVAHQLLPAAPASARKARRIAAIRAASPRR